MRHTFVLNNAIIVMRNYSTRRFELFIPFLVPHDLNVLRMANLGTKICLKTRHFSHNRYIFCICIYELGLVVT